jgi:hypothetical protein
MKKTKKFTKKIDANEPELTYWTEITYVCPKRGKVTEKVQVKKLKSQPVPDTDSKYELEILKEASEDDE